jgi:hypothetical protein
MNGRQSLSDASSITLTGFYDDGLKQEWDEPADHLEIDRWSNGEHDRLYINDGIAKADKYDLYVDLESHDVVSNNEAKHSGGDVEITGDTATVIIEMSGGKYEHEITLKLAGGPFDGGENDGAGHESDDGMADDSDDSMAEPYDPMAEFRDTRDQQATLGTETARADRDSEIDQGASDEFADDRAMREADMADDPGNQSALVETEVDDGGQADLTGDTATKDPAFMADMADDSDPDEADMADDREYSDRWPEALEAIRAEYDDGYGDRASFSHDVQMFIDGDDRFNFLAGIGREGVTQPILRYQNIEPVDVYRQIENKAPDQAERIREVLIAYADSLETGSGGTGDESGDGMGDDADGGMADDGDTDEGDMADGDDFESTGAAAARAMTDVATGSDPDEADDEADDMADMADDSDPGGGDEDDEDGPAFEYDMGDVVEWNYSGGEAVGEVVDRHNEVGKDVEIVSDGEEVDREVKPDEAVYVMDHLEDDGSVGNKVLKSASELSPGTAPPGHDSDDGMGDDGDDSMADMAGDSDPVSPMQRAGETVEFGSRGAANEFRDGAADGVLHPSSDDKRYKTVTLHPDVDDDAAEQAKEDARISKAGDRETSSPEELTDDEKKQLEARDNWTYNRLFEARRVKGALLAEGVTGSDWLNYYVPGEKRGGAMDRLEAAKDSQAERGTATGLRGEQFDTTKSEAEIGRETEKARGQAEQHAKDACEDGEPAACDELLRSYDYTEAEVDRLRSAAEAIGEDPDMVFADRAGDESPDLADRAPVDQPATSFDEFLAAREPEDDLDRALAEPSDAELAAIAPEPSNAPKATYNNLDDVALRTLRKAWTSYKAARSDAREQFETAEDMARVINGVRVVHGQDPLDFEAMEFEGGELLPENSDEFPAPDHPGGENEETIPEAADHGHAADSATVQARLSGMLDDASDPYDPTGEFGSDE